jgi:uncharacterized protein YqgV (UPF0045/DUF77 family)
MNNYRTFFEKFKVPEMMKELHSLGIKFADYHGGNMMKRGAEFVINDLGRSESPSKIEPPKLGEIVNKVVESLLREFAMSNAGTGMAAGSSAWSSHKNPVDPNSKELWQNQLDDLQLKQGQTDLPLEGMSTRKFRPIQDEMWIPWSGTQSVFDRKPHNLAGRGEMSFQIELMRRGIEAKNVGAQMSYDIDADKKYEVKELADVRIEKTGIPAVQEVVGYLSAILKALDNSVSEIDKEVRPEADWLAPHGLTLPQLKAFITTAQSAMQGTGIPLGLMSLTTKKGTILPVDFKTVMEAIAKLLKASEQKKKKGWAAFGDNEQYKEVMDREIDDSSARVIVKAISRELNVPIDSILDVSESVILLANFKEQGIRPDDINYEAVRNKYLQTFDPAKIMGEVDKIVIVDKERGFFIFDKSKIPEYLSPAGISKGVPKFRPSKKLRGPTVRRKKDPNAPKKVKKPEPPPALEMTQQDLPF